MASPEKSTGSSSSLWTVAGTMGYPTWPANLVTQPEFHQSIESEKVDIILNVHSLFIVHDVVLKTPRIGSFNLHPGPLPQYAGLNAVSWALYRGECQHAVTVHKMLVGIDTGPIAYHACFDIEEKDTALTLYSKCMKAGVPLILKLVETASDNPAAIPLFPQDLTKRKYYGRRIPDEGRIHWARPARDLVNFIRACDYGPFLSPWGHPSATLEGQDVCILKAFRTNQQASAVPGTVGKVERSGVLIASGDEWVLLTELTIDQQRLEARDVLRPGDRLHDGK